jgi:hypothetical protein
VTPPGAGTAAPPPSTAADAGIALPAGDLRELVPSPAEAPAGLVPLLQASGPRDAAAVAGFSPDPAAAAGDLAARGFASAYVAQYAAPADPRSLTTVVVRFADAAGATADLEADLTDGAGEVVPAPTVGEQSQVRRVALPGDDALDLVTVRFRVGPTTWVLAWRAPAPADPAVPLTLAQVLAARG